MREADDTKVADQFRLFSFIEVSSPILFELSTVESLAVLGGVSVKVSN